MATAKKKFTESDFDALKPIKNPYPNEGVWDGCMFETFGKDLKYVMAQPANRVWTYISPSRTSGRGLAPLYVVAGFHLFNRLGYFVTEKPWPHKECQFKVK